LPIRRDRASGRFAGGTFGHEVPVKRHRRVYDWLRNKPFGTQQQYGMHSFLCDDLRNLMGAWPTKEILIIFQ